MSGNIQVISLNEKIPCKTTFINFLTVKKIKKRYQKAFADSKNYFKNNCKVFSFLVFQNKWNHTIVFGKTKTIVFFQLLKNH